MSRSPRFSSRPSLLLTSLALLAATMTARADFTPPKDGKITEQQLTNYIGVRHDQFQAIMSASKAADGTQSSAAGMAIGMRMAEKVDAAVAAHGMTKDEFNWVDGVVNKMAAVAVWQNQWEQHGKPDLEKNLKTKQADKDAATKKLALYTQAQKDGRRVLTAEQHDSTTQSATSDRDSAAADVKDRENDLKAAKDELAQHGKEATDADNLTKNPPADVSADDKSGYIDGKKNEAQAARDAAKDSQAKVTDAQKALDDAKAKVTAATAKLDHPETPVTDDEKAQVKDENEKAIADAKSTIDADDQAIAAIADTLKAGSPMLAQLLADPNNKPDPDNLALMQKHLKEYLTAVGQEQMLDFK